MTCSWKGTWASCTCRKAQRPGKKVHDTSLKQKQHQSKIQRRNNIFMHSFSESFASESSHRTVSMALCLITNFVTKVFVHQIFIYVLQHFACNAGICETTVAVFIRIYRYSCVVATLSNSRKVLVNFN